MSLTRFSALQTIESRQDSFLFETAEAHTEGIASYFGENVFGEEAMKKYLPEIADPDSEISLAVIEEKYRNMKKVPKCIQNILQNKNIVERNMQLMDLHEGLMSVNARLKVSNMYETLYAGINKSDLTKRMIRCKLYSAFPNFETWFAPFLTLNRFYNESTRTS